MRGRIAIRAANWQTMRSHSSHASLPSRPQVQGQEAHVEVGVQSPGDQKMVTVIVSDGRCQKALDYLIHSDEDCAKLKTAVAEKEYMLDLAKKRVFLSAEGNIEERKAIAEVSNDVQEAVLAHLKALVAFEQVKARRTTAALLVDTWRSVNANRRTGNI
jgi:hypothetical protein